MVSDPLEQSVGVPTVHAALADGNLNDPRLELSLRDLLRALVDGDPERASA